jgi:predicted outer membrane repeat protein
MEAIRMSSRRIACLLVLFLLSAASACASATPTPPHVPDSATGTATAVSPTASATPAPSVTATGSAPSDAILVDTFEQEVSPFEQDGDCTLGEAIQAAQSGQDVDGCRVPSGSSSIFLPSGTYVLTQADNGSPPLPGAEGRMGFDPGGFPVIYTKVTILGNGAIIQRSGAEKFPIFQTSAQADLTLQDLTVRGGDSSDDPYASGGAIQLLLGKVTLVRVTLSGNVSGGDGGAVDVGPAPLASLVLEDSLIEGNLAAGNGGGINVDGTLTVKGSTIAANVAQGVEGGGGIFVSELGSAALDSSRVTGNQAWIGGGIYDQGSLDVTGGTVLSGNVAAESQFTIPTGGGAIATRGDSARLKVADSFIVGNQAPQSIAGGVSVNVADPSDFAMTGSVLAGNLASDGGGIAGGPGSVTGSCFMDNSASSGPGGDIDGDLQAGGNWWGPGGSPSVSGGASTAPVLVSAPPVCAAAIPTPYPTLAATPAAP